MELSIRNFKDLFSAEFKDLFSAEFKDLFSAEFKDKPSLASECSTKSPYIVGKLYHVRTVTMAIAGELVGIYDQELVFKNASWVADTARFSEYLKDSSKVKENEPFVNDVIIGRGAIVDCTEMNTVFTELK